MSYLSQIMQQTGVTIGNDSERSAQGILIGDSQAEDHLAEPRPILEVDEVREMPLPGQAGQEQQGSLEHLPAPSLPGAEHRNVAGLEVTEFVVRSDSPPGPEIPPVQEAPMGVEPPLWPPLQPEAPSLPPSSQEPPLVEVEEFQVRQPPQPKGEWEERSDAPSSQAFRQAQTRQEGTAPANETPEQSFVRRLMEVRQWVAATPAAGERGTSGVPEVSSMPEEEFPVQEVTTEGVSRMLPSSRQIDRNVRQDQPWRPLEEPQAERGHPSLESDASTLSLSIGEIHVTIEEPPRPAVPQAVARPARRQERRAGSGLSSSRLRRHYLRI